MPGQTMLDDVANDLALWIDQTATEIALAFAPARAPFAAQVTEEQKLEFYRQRLFNPDGSPNPQGRQEEMQRLGSDGFANVYKAVIKRYPELRVAPPDQPIEVPQEWPQHPAGRGLPPGGPMPGPVGAAPPLPGPPMPVPPPGPPRPPMVGPRGPIPPLR